MSTPEFDNWLDGGYGVADYSVSGIVANASNIRFGSNPAYGIADFVDIYPQFGTVDNEGNYTGALPKAALQMFINLASASLNIERYYDSWQFAMSLYVAHYATLFLQTTVAANASAKKIAQTGVAKGIQVSKSVGDVSVSYQSLVGNWEEYGAFNLTVFGQQLIQLANMFAMGHMYIP